MTGLIGLVFALALVGLIVYLAVTYIPMPPIFKTVIYVIVAICLIIFLIHTFGIADIPIPRFR